MISFTSIQARTVLGSEISNSVNIYDTGVPVDVLKYVGIKSVQLPSDFVSNIIKIYGKDIECTNNDSYDIKFFQQ